MAQGKGIGNIGHDLSQGATARDHAGGEGDSIRLRIEDEKVTAILAAIRDSRFALCRTRILTKMIKIPNRPASLHAPILLIVVIGKAIRDTWAGQQVLATLCSSLTASISLPPFLVLHGLVAKPERDNHGQKQLGA